LQGIIIIRGLFFFLFLIIAVVITIRGIISISLILLNPFDKCGLILSRELVFVMHGLDFFFGFFGFSFFISIIHSFVIFRVHFLQLDLRVLALELHLLYIPFLVPALLGIGRGSHKVFERNRVIRLR
jgi:hypothetical protein